MNSNKEGSVGCYGNPKEEHQPVGGLRDYLEVVGTPVYLGQTRRKKIPDSNNSDITVAHSVRKTSEMMKWGHRSVAIPSPSNVRH